MKRSLRCLLLVFGLVALAASAEAQIFRYMAFGDSITKGRNEFDPTGQGGYPGRLDDLLGCSPPDCEVINEGKDGEKTNAGVTRIENLLDNQGPWDVVLLMEGTNDVFNDISNNTIENNLELMDTKALEHGTDTLHGSIIHLDPDSTGGMDSGKVAAVANLRDRIEGIADDRNRYFADPWARLCDTGSCFSQHYHNPPGAVGHPDPSGFDILADEFRDSIEANSAPGLPSAVAPTGTTMDDSPTFTWNKEAGGHATWYQFRLLSGPTTLHDQWYEEDDLCGASTCNLNLGSFGDDDYTWEVRGRNPRDRSNWRSTAFTITTLLPPTAVTPLDPSGTTADLEPDFFWTRENPQVATGYQVQVFDSGGIFFDTTIATFQACTGSDCTRDFFDGDPLPIDDYSWRIRGNNSAGDGPWSALILFTVDPAFIFSDDFETGTIGTWDQIVN